MPSTTPVRTTGALSWAAIRRWNTASMRALATPKRTSSSQNTGNSAVTSFITKNEKPQVSAQASISSLLSHSASSRARRRPAGAAARA